MDQNTEPAKKFVREAIRSKETKNCFKFEERVEDDLPVFSNIYVNKWTKVRNSERIRVTIELI